MGQVEEAQAVMRRIEDLEKEREKERMAIANQTSKVGASLAAYVL